MNVFFDTEEFYPVYTIEEHPSQYIRLLLDLTAEELNRFNLGMKEYHAVQQMIREKADSQEESVHSCKNCKWNFTNECFYKGCTSKTLKAWEPTK